MTTVTLDFDDERTHCLRLQELNGLLIVTAYTVDMLRQSKVLLDNAKKAGVQHVVHPGACGGDDTTVAHRPRHQLVERYLEWHGFSYTHLRPKTYRLGYDAITFGELAALLTKQIGQSFQYEPLLPEVFLETMRQAGAEMALYGLRLPTL